MQLNSTHLMKRIKVDCLQYHPVEIDIKKPLPVAIADIKLIKEHCKAIDDDMRWLEALMSDIDMRFSVAAFIELLS